LAARGVIATKIFIIGPSGAGKSTLAEDLALLSGIENIELDDLLFRPGWVRIPNSEFRNAVSEIVARSEWIISGNYAGVRDLLWLNADVVVWLDFPLPVTLYRLILRTARRIISGRKFAGGNIETLSRALSARSIIFWAIRSHKKMKIEYDSTSRQYEGRSFFIRLRSPSTARNWADTVETVGPNDLPRTIKRALRLTTLEDIC
jgi:adenylate kinase family enzyme